MAIDPKNLVALEEIQEIVDTHLTALRFFPGGGSVAVARLLAELVDSTEQARQLCRHIVHEYDEWPGPATLGQEYRSLSGVSGIYREAPRLCPPPIQCQACGDWGVVRGVDGKWRGCVCWPDIPARVLTVLNRPPAPRVDPQVRKRRGRPLIPESQAELEAVLIRAAEDHQARLASTAQVPSDGDQS